MYIIETQIHPTLKNVKNLFLLNKRVVIRDRCITVQYVLTISMK